MTPDLEQLDRQAAGKTTAATEAFRWRLLPKITPLIHHHRVILGPELLALVRRRRLAQRKAVTQ